MCVGYAIYDQCYYCKCTNYRQEYFETYCHDRCRKLTAPFPIQFHQIFYGCLKCEELNERVKRGEDLLEGKGGPATKNFW